MFCKISDYVWDTVIYLADEDNVNKVFFMNVNYRKGSDYVIGSLHL
jgi:hypothetical protein